MHRHVKKLLPHDVGLTVLLGILFLQILDLYPFETSAVSKMMVHISLALILVSGVMTVVGTPIRGRVLLVRVILSLIFCSVTYVYPSVLVNRLNPLMAAIYLIILIVVILIEVFREGPINTHHLAGVISVYLLIGLTRGCISTYSLASSGQVSFSVAEVHT